MPENGVEEGVEAGVAEAVEGEALTLSDERFAEMAALDQHILTVAANGYGKRTSAYEYGVQGRGGQGATNIELRNGGNAVVASFPVLHADQIILVTDKGQMIRTTVDDIRIAGRATRGVIVFRVADDERVVSVSRLGEDEEEAGETATVPPVAGE